MSRTFASYACSMKRFRDLVYTQAEYAAFKKTRHSLWHVFKSVDRVTDWPCCYVIYIDGCLSYIGQTENLLMRMRSHIAKGVLRGVDLSRVTIKAKLSRRFGDWLMTEIRLIRRLKPALNIRLKTITRTEFC